MFSKIYAIMKLSQAVFESLTLGEFGTFFSCAAKRIRVETSKSLKLPTNLDGEGNMISFMIYALRELRNAVAHNGVVFDTYIVLIVYIFKKISSGTNDCKSFLHEYEKFCEGLRENLKMDEIWSEILGTNHRPIVKELENYIVPEKRLDDNTFLVYTDNELRMFLFGVHPKAS